MAVYIVAAGCGGFFARRGESVLAYIFAFRYNVAMEYIKDIVAVYKECVVGALNEYAKAKAVDTVLLSSIPLKIETPADPSNGDVCVALHPFAKIFHLAPKAIADEVVSLLQKKESSPSGVPMADIGIVSAKSGYANLCYNKATYLYSTLRTISEQGDSYGKVPVSDDGEKVMIEFSSPNTNKPLHLGHLRNDALGESVASILKAAGKEVFKVDLINDRGVHICKSMLAYKIFHEKQGDTPESLGKKGDHFVGDCYVEFDKYSKEHPEALDEAQNMLVEWERGNTDVRNLWSKMNEWTIGGIKATYDRTGVKFDKFYRESQTYTKGKDIIAKGLEDGVFFKATDGSVRIDVTAVVGKGKSGDTHEKVLLRSDGTSVYITQDIGTAVSRHEDFPFDRLIYVVASEQNDHFKMLFHILKTLGYPWATKLHHLSYGLVNLPNGRMKSREGTVVDADDLLDELSRKARAIIEEKGYVSQENIARTSEAVALGAVNYYLLNQAPQKDMTFDPEESLAFTGKTGPYIQYMGSRIVSILQKAKEAGLVANPSLATLLVDDAEFSLVKVLGNYPVVVARACENLDPSVIALYAYDLAKAFSVFYNTCPCVGASSNELCSARLSLAESTLLVLKNAMALILVPFLEKM